MKHSFHLFAGALLASFAALAAGEFNNAVLHGETNKERATEYRPGEEIVFTLTVQDAKPFKAGEYFIKWECSADGDLMNRKQGKAPAEEPLVIKTKLDHPGFVRVLAQVVTAKERPVRRQQEDSATTVDGKKAMNRFELKDKRVFFDGGAAVQPETLQGVPEPADFDAFWAKQKATLAAVPFKVLVKLTPCPVKMKQVEVFAVEIPCAGPRPVTGHITVPTAAKEGKKFPAKLTLDGYSGNIARWETAPTGGSADVIQLHINAHGYELGKDKDYYVQYAKSIMSHGKTYALAAGEHPAPNGCYFEGMTWRVMRALQYLKSRAEWNGKDLIVSGGSQGGLQSCWAAGLDPDVTVALPTVPWCCDMGGNATMGRVQKSWGVEWTPAMGYYDPIHMAKRTNPKCRVEIPRAGLGDYTCPPSGIQIYFNNLPCAKKINWVQGSTHGYVPPEDHQAYFVTGNNW